MGKRLDEYAAQNPITGDTVIGVAGPASANADDTVRFNLGTAAVANVTSAATDTTAASVVRNADLIARGLSAEAGSSITSQFETPTVIIRDQLRASVEAASGGRATVLYDDLGQPSYMVRIPKFMRGDIHADFGTGVHPAFVVNGVEKAEIWIGMHQAVVANNRALSLPGLAPQVNINWDTANTRCTAKGAGWHLMTNWEWAAVALWVLKQVADSRQAAQPRGNTGYGRAHDAVNETGALANNLIIGSTGTTTLTGSGPETWRHNLLPFGISDLVGNVWEWVGGLKLDVGVIKMPVDNHYTQADTAWASTGKTIAAATATTWKTATGILASGTYEAGYDDALMRSALILPANVSNAANGSYSTDLTSERVPRRGGDWANGAGAGLGALTLTSARSAVGTFIGFRPAYIA
jgi:formylglycine-generating enzyme